MFSKIKLLQSCLLLFSISIGGPLAGAPSLSEKKQQTVDSLPQGIISLDGFANGSSMHLLMTKQDSKQKELLYVRSNDGGISWLKPVSISITNGKINSRSRGYYPQVAGYKNKIAAVWNVPGNSKFGAGPLATAVSENSGKTWTLGSNPADDASIDRHAFLDLTVDSDGLLHAVWLDSRDGEQGLRYASSNDFGKSWIKNLSIDSRTCQCCWNRIYSFQSKKISVLYRDLNPRDMALAESNNSGASWKRVSSVGAFEWKFDGCPHMGGALAFSDFNNSATLYATVWTGKDDVTGPHWLSSSDFGTSWSAPQLIGSSRSNQPDIAATKNFVAIVWYNVEKDKTEKVTSAIKAKISFDQGRSWKHENTLSSLGSFPSSPQVFAFEKHFLFIWLEENEAGKSEWKSYVWKF